MASEIQRCVDTLGELLGLPVSLTDVDLNSLRFSPHAEDKIDDVRRDSLLLRTTAPWVREWFAEYGVGRSTKPVRVEPHPDRATMSRMVVPVSHRGMQLGLLCVLDPHCSCTEDDLDKVSDIIAELATLMYDEEADRLEVSRLLHELLTGGATARARAIKGLEQTSGLNEDTECVVVAVSNIQGPAKPLEPAPVPSAPRRTLSPTPARIVQCQATDHHVFLLRVDLFDQEPLDAQLRRITQAVRGCCQMPAVGVGEPSSLPEASTSYDQARAAMSAAARLEQLPGQVAFTDLGALRLLATRSDVELETTMDPQTCALLATDNEELRLTLTAYLDNGCDAASTAAQLNVHRGTLYYRLRKAEGATGLDLSRGTDRLTLHLGLLANRFVSSPRRAGHNGPVRLLPL